MFLYDRAKSLQGKFVTWGIDPTLFATTALLVLAYVVEKNDPDAFTTFLYALVVLSPLWLPIFLAVIFWMTWIDYIRMRFWFSWTYILLEIQLPQEVEKSPLAMETFLITLWNSGGETTLLPRIWRGARRPAWVTALAKREGRT